MRVLLFHGYLLRGTGSNVYNAELAQALAQMGHEVHLMCQDRQADRLDWVDAVGDWEGGSLRIRPTDAGPCGRQREGTITVHRPEIEGLLPVYVYDQYEGFEVKTYPDLSDEELDRYIRLNVAAVRELTEKVGGFDAALANHLVMAPVILARAGLQFAAKIHGSDLSYTVRPHPERFVPYAREGMEAASAALVGSLHTAEDLWATVDMPGLREKTRLGPPGLDPEEFAPRSRTEADHSLRLLAEQLRQEGLVNDRAPVKGSDFGRDPEKAAQALDWFAEAPAERVIFVGKLLVNKGVDLLLCAWPLVVEQHPNARLLLAGFGAFDESLSRLWSLLSRGEIAAAIELAASADEDGRKRHLRLAESFLASAADGYAEAARHAAGSVAVSGRLEHREVAVAVPAASALVMPSTFPEAFGMVTAEAAASGVFPISAGHSGMAEVSARLAEVLAAEPAAWLSFDLESDPVQGIADRINGWLGLAPTKRAEVAAQLRARAAELWSWAGVGEAMLSASAGQIAHLPSPFATPDAEIRSPDEPDSPYTTSL